MAYEIKWEFKDRHMVPADAAKLVMRLRRCKFCVHVEVSVPSTPEGDRHFPWGTYFNLTQAQAYKVLMDMQEFHEAKKERGQYAMAKVSLTERDEEAKYTKQTLWIG